MSEGGLTASASGVLQSGPHNSDACKGDIIGVEIGGTAGEAERQKDQDRLDAPSSEESGQPMIPDARKERKFVRKLDFILVTWAFFAYLLKMIDGTNYKTAYVSGMKEEMNMNANELNYLDIYFRIGYAIFLLPCQITLTRVNAKWFLPSCELIWGVMTVLTRPDSSRLGRVPALMAAAKNVKVMYALRFFIGVFEASSYPGIISVLCNWYSDRHLQRLVPRFSHVRIGHAGELDQDVGWFLGALGMEVAVPDSPGTTKIFWMSEENNVIARARMDRAERLPSTVRHANFRITPGERSSNPPNSLRRTTDGVLSKAFLGTRLPMRLSWHMGKHTWSFSQDSNGCIPAYGLMLLAMLGFAYVHARTGWHTTWIVVQETTLLIGAIILTIWPPGFAIKMVGFFLLFCSNAVGPILIAWMSAHFKTPEERGIVIGLAVTFVFPMSAWMSIVFYPAKHAPVYPIGYKAAIGFSVACIALTFLFRWLSERNPRVASVESEEEACGRVESEVEEKMDINGWKGEDGLVVPVLEGARPSSLRP
ncbi:hypothetical protein QFC19_000412 [Naganishia cerealis]|uniref:Uncharacterized protein n=1 Tax=Naganishia cerealis TaxID=610337 RepID=A0ACC2WP70_9TREE|nr:hypothetical protein QFC19_000412 [Naganishia cerealis]